MNISDSTLHGRQDQEIHVELKTVLKVLQAGTAILLLPLCDLLRDSLQSFMVLVLDIENGKR